MKMTPVTSSNIAAIGHCSDTEQLAVKFKNGKTFVYSDVSEDEWGMLMLSDSAGKHFNQFIKAVKVGREVVTAENDTTDMSDAAMSDKEKIKVLREALLRLRGRGVEYINSSDFEDDEDRASIESYFNDALLDSYEALEATKDGE